MVYFFHEKVRRTIQFEADDVLFSTTHAWVRDPRLSVVIPCCSRSERCVKGNVGEKDGRHRAVHDVVTIPDLDEARHPQRKLLLAPAFEATYDRHAMQLVGHAGSPTTPMLMSFGKSSTPPTESTPAARTLPPLPEGKLSQQATRYDGDNQLRQRAACSLQPATPASKHDERRVFRRVCVCPPVRACRSPETGTI